MTRSSGFSAAADVRMKLESIPSVRLSPGDDVRVRLHLTRVDIGDRIGFGGWFLGDDSMRVVVSGEAGPLTLSNGSPPAWRKLGSQWLARTGKPVDVEVEFQAFESAEFALYGLSIGIVGHDGIDGARPELLRNMAKFAPEGNFYAREGVTEVSAPSPARSGQSHTLALKSCNRCGRFLPVNLPPHERSTLSYSNHCVSRAPCKHASFGRIQDADTPGVVHTMHYGFQLECRFCKKFFVNAALNPQRTAGQMKEDGARRRAFEVLLEHLYRGSLQLRYKTRSGPDLADEVYQRFGGRCFKCGIKMASAREMNLDHTRPLALLWPLDEHATALCADHNSEKRDRPPNEYYSTVELARLAEKTNLSLVELSDPTPNADAIMLLGDRLDWFFDEFIPSGQLDRVREGKATAALLVKAIQRAIDRLPGGPPYNIVEEAARRGIR